MSGCTRQGGLFVLPSSSRLRALLPDIAPHLPGRPSQRPPPTGITPTRMPHRWPEVVVTLSAVVPTARRLGAPCPDRSEGASLPLGVSSRATGSATTTMSTTSSRLGATLTRSPALLSEGMKAPPWITSAPRCSGRRSERASTLGDSGHRRTSLSTTLRPT
jgi:hypothetical protein